MLKGKTVVLGITGSIAAYKMANVASMLAKQHCDVQVIMTKNATQFITPLTFETLCNTRCMVDTFDRNFQYNVEHVALAKRADLVDGRSGLGQHHRQDGPRHRRRHALHHRAGLPLQKAGGPRDEHPTCTKTAITQGQPGNAAPLRLWHHRPGGRDAGLQGCGRGQAAKRGAAVQPHPAGDPLPPKDLAGTKGAGHRRAYLRTGRPRCASTPTAPAARVGYALARECSLRGADVTLVTGKTALEPWPFVKMVPIETAQQMFDEVTSRAPEMDIIIKAAAVADYRPKTVADQKLKKGRWGIYPRL